MGSMHFLWHSDHMPVDFTDEEHLALTTAVRRTIAGDIATLSPRLETR